LIKGTINSMRNSIYTSPRRGWGLFLLVFWTGFCILVNQVFSGTPGADSKGQTEVLATIEKKLARLSETLVSLGQEVKRLQTIGMLGDGRLSFGLSLYFEIREENDLKILWSGLDNEFQPSLGSKNSQKDTHRSFNKKPAGILLSFLWGFGNRQVDHGTGDG